MNIDYFSKRMVNKGTALLGGCYEAKSADINAISELKQI